MEGDELGLRGLVTSYMPMNLPVPVSETVFHIAQATVNKSSVGPRPPKPRDLA